MVPPELTGEVLQLADRLAAFEAHLVPAAVGRATSTSIQSESGIHHRCADAVQTPPTFVNFAAEIFRRHAAWS